MRLSVVVYGAFVAMAMVMPGVMLNAAAVSTATIPIQGQVGSSGGDAVPDAAYRMSFSIFDVEEGGAPLWTEIQFTVFVVDGFFATQLGLETALTPEIFSGREGLWVETAIDVDQNGLDEGDVQQPRKPLSAVPVAFQARDASGLGGFSGESYARLAELYTKEAVDAIVEARNTLIGLKADAVDVQAQLDALDALVAAKALPEDVETDITNKQPRSGENYIVVPTVDDPIQNGLNLLASYAEARAQAPNGAALSPVNRMAVIVPPGRYDLAALPLVLDTEHVDLIGMITSRESQWLRGAPAAQGFGVIMQSANDVRIENLSVELYGETSGFDDLAPAAYFPESDLPNTIIRNCAFLLDSASSGAMRSNIVYSGVYIDCHADGLFAFAGRGDATGVFIRCTAGGTSFGGGTRFDSETSLLIPATVSGLFIDCRAGSNSFGTTSAIVSGTFINCDAGGNSFGALGTASGYFLNCRSGTLENPGAGSFGGFGGTASGIFIRSLGGTRSFGGNSNTFGENIGSASGYFEGCIGGSSSFGGDATGVFRDCTGGDFAFGGITNTPVLALPVKISGTFIRCEGGSSAFGGGGQGIDWTGTPRPRFIQCRMTGSSWVGTFNGVMENSHWNTGLTLGNGGHIYNSTILGLLNLNNSSGGVAHSRISGGLQSAGNASFNEFNLIHPGVE